MTIRKGTLLDDDNRGSIYVPEVNVEQSSHSGLRALRRRDIDHAAPASWNVARRYAVVVDAGSSGSRMQVYSWTDPLVDRTQREHKGKSVKALPKVEKGTWEGSGHEWQLKVEPGLSTFGKHPQDLDPYLKKLFDHASAIVPPEAVGETPVYVLATAGMRLLPEDERTAVLDATCSFIRHQTPFNLGIGGCADHVQVITGEEEGLLGWIAINYLMDGFHFQPSIGTSGTDDTTTEGQSTFGFLDMGGASTQIAFEPSDTDNAGEDLTPISLRLLDGTDVMHNVFVTTFLGFGTNRARDRYLDVLTGTASPTQITASNAEQIILDPCLPKGLRKTTGPDRAPIEGTGQFDQCLESLTPLLNKDASCSRPPCLFHGVHVPAIDFSVNHFIGVSEYWFSSNDIFHQGGVYDFVTFQKASQTFCSTPWEQLTSQLSSGTIFGKQVTQDRLEMQCFKSAWMAAVLHDGIGLPRITDPGGKGDGRVHAIEAQGKADAKNLFQSVNDVGGLSVSWTLGKAVLESSKNIPPLPATTGPNSAPVHGISTQLPAGVLPSTSGSKWQDKFRQPLYTSQELMRNKPRAAPGAAIVLLFAVLVLVCMCCLRGRSAKAIKRRAYIKDVVRAPCGRRRGGQGDYTLASMEEGGGSGLADGSNGGGDVALGSDSSGEEDAFSARSRYHDKRRRSSGNSLMAALLVPLQRLRLALGFKNAVSRTSGHPISMGLAGQRRIAPPRYGMRHQHPTVLPISMSQPSSPRPFSPYGSHSAATGGSVTRPASRAEYSPRLNAHNGSAPSYFSQRPAAGPAYGTSASSNTATATATASARSSRAASPVFGLTSSNNNNNNNNHHQHHLYPHQFGAAPTSGGSSNGRLTPSSRTASSGFSRKAWEDSD